MGSAARKERKAMQRATGTTFTHPAKVGTPLTERAWFTQVVPGPNGTRHEGKPQMRSEKKWKRALDARGEGVN